MMKPKEFIHTMQEKVAVSAVGPSALRNQGPGTLYAAQGFLAAIRLSRVPKSSERRFAAWLQTQTEALLDQFPGRERPWGSARKAINLFLRDSLYNQYLAREYDLAGVERWLEIPLDRAVARGLREMDMAVAPCLDGRGYGTCEQQIAVHTRHLR